MMPEFLRVKKSDIFLNFRREKNSSFCKTLREKKQRRNNHDHTTDAPYSQPECKKALTAPPTAGALLLKLAPLSALLIFLFLLCVKKKKCHNHFVSLFLFVFRVFDLSFKTLNKLNFARPQKRRERDRGESSKVPFILSLF